MPEHSSRPKIGLALGGGVARGWAHIGAIRALEKAGFKPDIVCGTSIGALVGGFYLAGRLDELEEWALSLNKRRLISYLDIVTKSSGMFGGKKLERLMLQYINGITIEELDRKFAAVATELATGHEIWIQHGSLAKGIEASYALPGVFPPVRHENRWLIDGALVNPVPVSTCRALGARLVVAVSLNYDAFGKSNIQSTDEFAELEFGTVEDINSKRMNRPMTAQRVLMRQVFGTGQKSPGIGSVMLGSLNIIMDRLSRSRLAGDPADVLIAPRIGHISLLEFDRAEELIQLGEESVEQILPFIEEAMAILSI